MSKPKVTIGVCVKNVEHTVEEAIVSIIDQDYPHESMEVVVVDGFSKDRTVSVIKKHLLKADIRHMLICDNKGLGAARNLVVESSNGHYIVWVDGDMVLSRDFVRKQVEFMECHPDVAIAGGKFRGWRDDNLFAALDSAEWVAGDHQTESEATSRPLRHFCGGTIYRVEAVREVGGFDSNITGALEDLDIEYRLGEAGWLLFFTTDATFHDRRKNNLKDLWNENFWYGYGGHMFLHKHGRPSPVSIGGLSKGIRRSFIAYRLTGRKIVFLLLLQYIYKKAAWLSGYLKSHFDGYGHERGELPIET